MAGVVEILDVTRGFFRDKVTIRATSECYTVWDSLMGPRKFYLREGHRIRVSIGKRLYREGELVAFDEVCTSSNAFDFSWCWHY
jgi:hypothetical protein